MDEHDNDQAAALKRLRILLTAAGFQHSRGPANQRQLLFMGQFREWVVFAKLTAEWFHVHATVCSLPAEPGLRAELLLWLARANAKMAMLKYSVTVNDTVVLEFESRAEALTQDAVLNSVWYLETTAEDDYKALFRLASGEARLEGLAGAFSLGSKEHDAAVNE